MHQGRLIHLEVDNFKSYRGHQIIGPFDNFTSIIGPNGSGKSNLMDAISFVLGVKSSHLRSSQLKDLIYRAETASRGHVSGRAHAEGDDDELAPTSAQVTAVYRGAEDQDVRFSRIILPNGTSEYRIDGKTVPYSVYSSTLEEENILIKARNFLVFQGDVEAVASQSPKDLTKLIEQISGSLEMKSEYDKLKQVQERATENSTFNFNKKRGIAAEMKQFREQKEEAERFEKLIKEKRKLIISYMLWKLYHYKRQISDREEEIAEEKLKSEEKFNVVAAAEEDVKSARKASGKLTKEALKAEKQVKDLKIELDDRTPALLKLNERIKHTEKKIAQAKANLAKAEKSHADQTASVEHLEGELEEVINGAAKYEASVAKKLAKTQAVSRDEADLTAYQKIKEQVNSKTLEDRQKLSALKRELKTGSENRRRMEDQREDLNGKLSRKSEEKILLDERVAKLSESSASINADLAVTRKELDFVESERRRLRQQEKEKNEQIGEFNTKLSQARAERHENERGEKKREALEGLKRVFTGVHGRLSDLCKPTQRKFDIAVSTILGKNMDSIVVDTKKTGIDCIQYLREQRVGTATFLPLDELVVKGINEKYRNLVRGARLAIDVVQVEPRFERAVQFACGSALVCDTLDIAKDVCWSRGQEVKAVTVDGAVLHKTGLMTGGVSTAGARDARRWEEKEIEGMRRAMEALRDELGEIHKARRKLASNDTLLAQINVLENRRNVMEDDLNTTKRKIATVEKESDHIRKELESGAPELEELRSSLSHKHGEVKDLEAKIFEIEDAAFAKFCLKVGVANIREYEEGQGALQKEIELRRMEFQTSRAKLDFERKQAAEVQERITKLKESIADDESRLDELGTSRHEHEEESKRLEAEMERLSQLKETTEAKVSEAKNAIEEARKGLAKANKEVELINKAIGAKEAQIEKLNAERISVLRRCKLEEIDLPLESGSMDDISLDDLDVRRAQGGVPNVDTLDESHEASQEFVKTILSLEVDFGSLKKNQRENDSEDMDNEFQESVRDLTSEIEKISPNMRAIEKYDDVETKLKATADEFENARREAKAARDAFNAVKQKRFQLFNDAFRHISESIDPIYKELTKSKTFPLGGTAYLSLEDSDEPYLDGIKYHAMPPMKRFRDMEQLSGGEKTVAALALLFAVHSYRPAPFFVLDEVDAALDNANVGRVAAYIRKRAAEATAAEALLEEAVAEGEESPVKEKARRLEGGGGRRKRRKGEEGDVEGEVGVQFIVISLKSMFYEKAEALVGIYRDQEVNSSKILTMRLRGRFEE
ncbi:Structural maintenance of chromosomes protein 1 [Dinochytrium kinnereticum]|nr:Structural maintenance of chromosomes protein 1 [Dinochytrium kinnereticum]